MYIFYTASRTMSKLCSVERSKPILSSIPFYCVGCENQVRKNGQQSDLMPSIALLSVLDVLWFVMC